MHIYTYIYIYFQSFKYDIGTKIIMSTCLDHTTTFPNTRRHFRLAIEIPRNVPILCGGLELKKEQLKKQTCLDSKPIFLEKIQGRNNFQTPYVQKKGLSNAQFKIRMHFELCIFRVSIIRNIQSLLERISQYTHVSKKNTQDSP